MREKWRLYQNYIIIAILSFVSVVILPLFGSQVGVGFILPDTTAGWVVYFVTKSAIVAINVLIFDQFMRQAKVNVRDNELYIKAEALLLYANDDEELLPTTELIAKMYRSKIVSTIIFSILGVFGFTQAILTFDYVQMLSYTITIVIALVFGWVSMNQAEEIWTVHHYKWALKTKKTDEEAQKNDNARRSPVQES